MSNPFTIDFAIDTESGGFEDYTRKQVSALEDGLLAKVDEINNAMAENLRWAYSGGVVQRRTGAAADSVKVLPAERDAEYIVGSVQAGGDSAPEIEFLEYGTKPHVIYPTEEGGVLAFMMGGKQVFAAYVFHPGTKAYRIFEALEETAPEFEQELQDVPESIFG